jgi:hypothetical protein
MTHLDEEAPKGWSEVCALLQTERDPDKFRELLIEMNHLLSAHEKANRQERSA